MTNHINKQVAIWLYCGAIAIFIQIVLGGITRLTGSGLSITEWRPLLGILPPLTEESWQHSFNLYKQIAQFKIVNQDFSLSDYKSIFFWEWLHRNWARMLGIIFIFPFFVFLAQRKINSKMMLPLSLLFILGLLQAVIGWVMVKSGLNDTSIAVSDIRLAIHFVMALLLLCYTLWIAFKLNIPVPAVPNAAYIKRISGLILIVIAFQMFYGALMAGSKAALAAPTWPDMNGYIIPPQLYKLSASNSYLLMVQFVHRLLAYSIAILTCIFYYKSASWKTHRLLSSVRKASIILIFIQVALGITTLLNSFDQTYRIYALLHQSAGLLLLINMLLTFYLSKRSRKAVMQII